MIPRPAMLAFSMQPLHTPLGPVQHGAGAVQGEPVGAAAGVQVEPEDGRARRGPHGGPDPREDGPPARRDLVQLKEENHATSSTKICTELT